MKASIQRNAIVALSVFCVAIMGNGQLLAQASQAPANTGNFAKLTDFLPPPPNAAAMIQHAEISVNKNTGSPSVGVTLYSLQGNKLATTVSLGYSSTGLKVDELASRVGMGWSLNAGGVVTRTLRGLPDELNTRLLPPFPLSDNCGTYNYMNTIASDAELSGYAGGKESEPDLFNFNMNGISGSFVFDENMQPVLIPADKLKIAYNFTTGATWNFKITATDGVTYYFGGASATEKTKRESTCGKSFNVFLANAWYLTKIEHPNGEVINFTYLPHTYNYDNGVSQTMHAANGQPSGAICGGANCPAVPAPTKCIAKVKTQGVLLHTIFNNRGTIQFSYTTRNDCEDKLVSEVKLTIGSTNAGRYNLYYTNQLANMMYANEYALGYNYTPYLTNIVAYDNTYTQTKSHFFTYNDAGARPPRLSFSQDHWGYFNGKANSSFVPRPNSADMRAKFPQATANREADENFAAKGLLCKVAYPTGGIDSLIYESNTVQASSAVYRPYHELACSVTGTSFSTQQSKTNS